MAQIVFVALSAFVLGTAITSTSFAAALSSKDLRKIHHYVVVYMENHSFDNRFGGWEGVNGRQGTYIPQVNQNGGPYACLPQSKLTLISPPLPVVCTDQANNVQSAFLNESFNIATYQNECDDEDIDCNPKTSMVHQFYQEQYQINQGHMDRFVVASDATGLTVGYTDTKTLPIYKLLHERRQGLNYAVLDNFYHAAFGGSFLNHQWLISARTPIWANAANDGGPFDLHSVVDTNGMPNSADSKTQKYNPPLYQTPATYNLFDKEITASCTPPANRGSTPPNIVCGDYAVNTTQPGQQPYKPSAEEHRRLPLLTTPNIGDALSAKGVSWAWYSGGWSNANGDIGRPGWTNGRARDRNCNDPSAENDAVFPICPDDHFSYHHQPFNFYRSFDRTTEQGRLNRRIHLRDEAEFISQVDDSDRACKLRQVSFVKPLKPYTEHSRGGLDLAGSKHLADIVKLIANSACMKNTMIIVAYDENGGEFDHVAPPGQGGKSGPHDQWGPGSRVPALVISPLLPEGGSVDHTQYDTTSILRTLEKRYGLAPLNTRDAEVNDLFNAFGNATPLPVID